MEGSFGWSKALELLTPPVPCPFLPGLPPPPPGPRPRSQALRNGTEPAALLPQVAVCGEKGTSNISSLRLFLQLGCGGRKVKRFLFATP